MPATIIRTNTSVKYPDDEDVKEVVMEATRIDGARGNLIDPRHVLIRWLNGWEMEDAPVDQLVQLEKRGSNYHYFEPNVKLRGPASRNSAQKWVLGHFTRDQRETILEMAGEVEFAPQSLTNDCRVWMRRLLGAMATSGLIDRTMYLSLCDAVPLPTARPEPEQRSIDR